MSTATGGRFFGLNTSYTDKVIAVTLLVILIVVFIVLLMHVNRGSDFWDGLDKPTYAPPAWLYFTMIAAAIVILWYGGTVIFTQTHPDDKATCCSLWIISLVLLYGSFLAFWERRLIVESTYLLMLFLAFHVSIAYKLQFVNSMAAMLYGIGAVVMVYFIILGTELQRLNPK